MKTKTLLSFLFLLILSTSLILVKANTDSSINLTITGDKQTYDKYAPITLSGSLQYNGLSPSDGLIGVQIQSPTGGPMVLRTVETGTATELSLPETITSAYSSDLSGKPVGTVQNGATGFFTMTISSNPGYQAQTNMLFAISIYDGNGVPLGLNFGTATIGVDTSITETVSIPIPTTAHAGTAYGYADLYSGWPQNGAFPMAQEKSFQFKISGGTPSSGPAPSTNGGSGAYSMTFKLPKNTPTGTYQVYASSIYPSPTSGFSTTATTSFYAFLMGDFNGDGVVNGEDLFVFENAYIQYYLGQPFNPLCDMNNEGKVDASDFFLFLSAYIQYWSP